MHPALRRFFPLLGQLDGYDRANLRSDVTAGLTTAVMLIPQAMAYAMLAGLDPIIGLYASTVPLAVYGLLGVLAIPLNYFAIELFGGAAMHPENLERDSLGAGMRAPFALAVLTGLVAYWHLLLLRADVERLRAHAAGADSDWLAEVGSGSQQASQGPSPG